MELCNRAGIGQRIAATLPAAPDGDIERRTQNHVVEGCRDFPERFQEPRPDNAVHDDEVAAAKA